MDPITSYGIILFYIDDKNIWYLLSQRRDSIHYINFLSGHWNYTNVYECFKYMTHEERKKLLEYTFDELWDDLWLQNDHNRKHLFEKKNKAILKFNSIKDSIPKCIKDIETEYPELTWGFPKGRKKSGEHPIDCAFREFREEAGFGLSYKTLLVEYPEIELEKGGDKYYQTIYYLAQAREKIQYKYRYIGGIREYTISEEVADLKWDLYEDAIERLPEDRKIILKNVHERILKIFDI